MRKYSMSSVIRKMQIKTKWESSHPPEWLRLTHMKCWTECRVTGSITHCWWVWKNTILWEKFWNLKPIIQHLWHNNSLSRCLHKRNKNMFTKDLYKNIHNTQNIHNYQKLMEQPGDFQQEMGSEAYLYNRVWPSKK